MDQINQCCSVIGERGYAALGPIPEQVQSCIKPLTGRSSASYLITIKVSVAASCWICRRRVKWYLLVVFYFSMFSLCQRWFIAFHLTILWFRDLKFHELSLSIDQVGTFDVSLQWCVFVRSAHVFKGYIEPLINESICAEQHSSSSLGLTVDAAVMVIHFFWITGNISV